MIELDVQSRTKNPTPIPSVVRNPTPPKNLRLCNPGSNPLKMWEVKQLN